MTRLFAASCLFFIVVMMTACAGSRPVQYVQGSFDTSRLSQYVVKEPVIQVGDLISIVVYSDNPNASLIYNTPNVSGASTAGSSTSTSGYLVDEQGDINFQGLGKLHIAGLTKQQLKDLLNSRLTTFLVNPYYNIRFLNYKITLIGEVTREGLYSIPNERVNILEAVGLAGGLTIYARRDNVVVIREVNGKREFARLDLTSPEIFQSPYYFLQQNDIVVVEQSKGKTSATDQVTIRNISLASTVISTIVIVLTVFRK